VILCGAVLLLLLQFGFGNFEGEKLTQTMIVCLLIKAGVSVDFVIMYTYGNEMFPSNIRGTAFGIGVTAGKMIGL
jgi:hypothetical protein